MMRLGKVGGAFVAASAMLTAPPAMASPAAFCDGLTGSWNGQYCQTSVASHRSAVRDIKIAVPGELIDDPVAGPVLRTYLTTLVDNWTRVGRGMAANSFGEANYQVFEHGGTTSVVFRETYHADGPDFNNAYRTFTFGAGRQLQLADLLKPGLDPLTAIPPLAHPFIERALSQAAPQHQPGSYPFQPER